MSNFRIDAELKNLRLIQGGKTDEKVGVPKKVCEDQECCKISTRIKNLITKTKTNTVVQHFCTKFCNSCGWILQEEEETSASVYPTTNMSIPIEKVACVETRRPFLDGGADVMYDLY